MCMCQPTLIILCLDPQAKNRFIFVDQSISSTNGTCRKFALIYNDERLLDAAGLSDFSELYAYIKERYPKPLEQQPPPVPKGEQTLQILVKKSEVIINNLNEVFEPPVPNAITKLDLSSYQERQSCKASNGSDPQLIVYGDRITLTALYATMGLFPGGGQLSGYLFKSYHSGARTKAGDYEIALDGTQAPKTYIYIFCYINQNRPYIGSSRQLPSNTAHLLNIAYYKQYESSKKINCDANNKRKMDIMDTCNVNGNGQFEAQQIQSQAFIMATTVLNLENSGLTSVQLHQMEDIKNVETLFLNNNLLEDVNFLDSGIFKQLWSIDLSINKLSSLEGLIRYQSIGYLNLQHNHLTWSEILKLRHVNILNIQLSGNPDLGNDYRLIVIYLMPYIWCIDGWFVSQYERMRAATFVQQGEANVQFKFARMHLDGLKPTPIERHMIFTNQHNKLIQNFSRKAPQSRQTDQRRLRYLVSQFSQVEQHRYLYKDQSLKMKQSVEHLDSNQFSIQEERHQTNSIELDPEFPYFQNKLQALNEKEKVTTFAILAASMRYNIPPIPLLYETLVNLIEPFQKNNNIALQLSLLPPFAKSSLLLYFCEKIENAKDFLSETQFFLPSNFAIGIKSNKEQGIEQGSDTTTKPKTTLFQSKSIFQSKYLYQCKIPAELTSVSSSAVWLMVQAESACLPPPQYRPQLFNAINQKNMKGAYSNQHEQKTFAYPPSSIKSQNASLKQLSQPNAEKDISEQLKINQGIRAQLYSKTLNYTLSPILTFASSETVQPV
ncbi:MAG: hypothetical protein EZS28_003462 [Streblomastix strix]|uniref:Uncharacterized protein n=1 Tax=Streblomastix strix TaxID=222440 RepID=A0A5J4X1C5_9EUKA|nr:MAG: hypothetical protein EZS28_003462 [Streblomastix strix]